MTGRYSRAWSAATSRNTGQPRSAARAASSQAGALADRLRQVLALDQDLETSLASFPFGGQTDPPSQSSLTIGIGSSLPDQDAAGGGFSLGQSSSEGGRFRLIRRHARGGIGMVFVALDSELHREVALKQMLPQHADDLASRARFLLEAEVTGRLEHPGIVPVYGLGTNDQGRLFYAMRFVRGQSLKEAIESFHGEPGRVSAGSQSTTPAKTRSDSTSPLASRQLLRRFIDVCNAIAYAHTGA